MSNEILYFIVVLVQNVIITCFVDGVFEYKWNRKLSNVIVFLFLTGLFLVTTPIINLKPLKLAIIILGQTIGFKMVSKNTWKHALKQTLIIVALTLLTEIISSIIGMVISYSFNTRMDIDTATVFDTLRILNGSLLIPVLMSVVFMYLMFYRKLDRNIKLRLALVFVLIPLTMVFVYYIVYSYNIETFTDVTLWFIVIISILFAALIVIMNNLVIKMQEYNQNEKELELLKQKENLQLEYYKLMRVKEEEIRKINHDIKNNLQMVYTLNNDKRKEELVEKINDNLKKYELVRYSKNDILNIILNTKISAARSNDIDVEVNLKKTLDFMDDLDISNLFSNLLDNAIEASCKSKDKKIKLSIYKKLDYIVIQCSNSYDGKVVEENKKIVSRKNDKSHGYGLRIIDDIVKKYHGEKNIDYNDDTFTINLLIKEAD